jgi:hypothetical protein
MLNNLTTFLIINNAVIIIFFIGVRNVIKTSIRTRLNGLIIYTNILCFIIFTPRIICRPFLSVISKIISRPFLSVRSYTGNNS